MSKRDDGGAAFPVSDEPGNFPLERGMSLRDWFAGMALQGVLALDSSDVARKATAQMAKKFGEATPEVYSALAYELADAMLAAREKE